MKFNGEDLDDPTGSGDAVFTMRRTMRKKDTNDAARGRQRLILPIIPYSEMKA
jgi:hypothetical protein